MVDYSNRVWGFSARQCVRAGFKSQVKGLSVSIPKPLDPKPWFDLQAFGACRRTSFGFTDQAPSARGHTCFLALVGGAFTQGCR